MKAFSLTNHKLVNTYPAVNTAIEKGYSVFCAPQLKNVPESVKFAEFQNHGNPHGY